MYNMFMNQPHKKKSGNPTPSRQSKRRRKKPAVSYPLPSVCTLITQVIYEDQAPLYQAQGILPHSLRPYANPHRKMSTP